MSTRFFHDAVIMAFAWVLVSGCASPREAVISDDTAKITISYTDSYGEPIYAGRPTIEASINGVSGRFVIDTGSASSSLTTTAARRCGLTVLPNGAVGLNTQGNRVPLMAATNVMLDLAPKFSIHWREILVLPGEVEREAGGDDNFFGVIDYRTLLSAHAVMDTQHKTITLSR